MVPGGRPLRCGVYAAIEAKSAAKGINLRATDPVALVTQAATIVLSDEANEEMIKAINNGGHAFFAGKFDARKRPPSNAGHNAGGQTWQSNANGPAWNKDMRLCEMCPDGTPDNARGHMDKSCKYATPEKLAARGKMLEEKRATRKADWEKQKAGRGKGNSGSANLATALDGADEENAASIFGNGNGEPIIIELNDLIGEGKGRSFMAAGADTATPLGSTAAPSVAGRSTAPTPSDNLGNGSSCIYVIGTSGDAEQDNLSAGIYVGGWNYDVVPFVAKAYRENQLELDSKELKLRSKRMSGLESAVALCVKLDILPEYQGPARLEGLDLGESVELYLQRANEGDDGASEPEPSSGDDTTHDSEPEEDTNDVPDETGRRLSTTDLNGLYDSMPPTQPQRPASKFNLDLGTVAGARAPPSPAAWHSPAPATPLPKWLPIDELMVEIEEVDINTHMDYIKELIANNQLKVSPAVGGPRSRTKLDVINDMRKLVGSDPLPPEVLLRRRAKPSPRPPVPMGVNVELPLSPLSKPASFIFDDACGRHEAEVISERQLPPSAKHFRDLDSFHLFFDDHGNGHGATYAVPKAAVQAGATPPQRRPWRARFCSLLGYLGLALFVALQMMLLLNTAGPSFPTGLIQCRTFAPEWTCSSFGYVTSPPAALPTTDAIAAEPGALSMSQAPHGHLHGGASAWALLLPMMLCLILVAISAHATAKFAYGSPPPILISIYHRVQASWLDTGPSRPKGSLRATTTRNLRRHGLRSAPGVSSSRFISTLGAAPLWLSTCFLALEISTVVVPSLAALSIATLAANLLRGAYVTLRCVCNWDEMMPARVALRLTVNSAVAITYLVLALTVSTVVSDRPFITAAELGAPNARASASASMFNLHTTSRLGAAATFVDLAARSTLRSAGNDLYRCGGAVLDKMSTKIPADTDPFHPADYSHNDSTIAPRRALHAFSPSKINGKRAKQLLKTGTQPPPRANARKGQALLGRHAPRFPIAPPPSSKVALSSLICWSVIDSGCSWHCHPNANDLVNTRRCSDTMTGIDGKPQTVTCIGDLPALTRDHLGVWRRIVIKNVRCVPTFSDTLISVDQFWQDSQVDTIFNSTRCIAIPGKGEDPPLDIPFERKEHLYKWAFIPTSQHASLEGAKSSEPRALKATIHRPNSTSFFGALPPNEALEVLHRRLHVGYDLIRKLGRTSCDIPANISKAQALDCTHCKIANATRVPHSGKAYAPSHVGRLIHGDLAGPFKRSQHGFTYFLVLVDDHSRFKQVYFLKHKDEAPRRIKSFVAKLNSICNVGKPESERVRIIGQLHLDNAGEFLSREFTEYLDNESIARTTCPPHVHQLNGVAERAIRSVMEIVRATREASGCPVGFWPHLVEHAIDVLNRTTGPPLPLQGDHPDMCSYESVTGQQPKILTILPIGCRAYAVKPITAYTKSGFESRAWAGINLGRSSTIPGAYNIWLPSQHKLIQTSEVYFDESLYPWRPSGDQRIGMPTPTAAPPSDEDDISAGGASSNAAPVTNNTEAASTLPESFASATRAAQSRVNTSIKVLLLFSGAYRRPDGLAQFARRLGLEVELFDNDPTVGGGDNADITNDDIYDALRERISRGEYAVIFAAPPCSTFSISRFFESKASADGGPPIVRTRTHIDGARFVPPKHRAELERANNVVARTAALLLLAHRAGTEIAVENPCDRGDITKPGLFLHADHGPLWLMPAIRALADKTSAKFVDFAMCAFGAEWQKETTIMYTAGLDAWFDSLSQSTCEHSTHAKTAGGSKVNDKWNSGETAAYPPDFNSFVAQAIANFVRQRQSPAQATAPPPMNASVPIVAAPTAHAPTATLPDVLKMAVDAIDTASAVATDSTSIRKLSFDDEGLDTIHEEPEPEELTNSLEPPPPHRAPTVKTTKPKVTFEKTAGARGTRSNNPAITRGLGTSHDFEPTMLRSANSSTGHAMLALGMTISSAVFAMGTVDLLSEIGKPGNSLSAALAKPSAADPKSQTEAYAQNEVGWKASELKELKNHQDNGSWEYIDANQLPRGRRLVKLVWVYKYKRDGSQKSRLCVQGCRQVPGVDFDQTWCGAMRGTSLRVLSNLAANSGMRMRRYDFVAAYLQGELLEGETVYCYPPPGYERKGKDGRNQICKILKPVYGMAQAGRRWQRTLFPWLLKFGFTQTHSDQSVFTLERTMETPNGPRLERMHVGVYVDDLAVVYSHDDKHSLYRTFLAALEKRWKVEDEGELTDLLGIEFTRGDKTVELRQTKYIEKLSNEFFPDGVPPTAQQNKVPCDRDLPAVVNLALIADETPDAALLRKYQSICGALLYASTNTRPDIAFSTGLLCRAMGRPTPELFDRALRVLGYIYRTRHIGLRYEASTTELEGFSDSDWGVKHSTSGHTFHMGSATISWASKKQTSVALSSCEAEIMAGSEAAKEAIYLSNFLRELGLNLSGPPPLKMDNKSAIDLAYNPEHHARTKHIDRRHYFIRECVENGRLRVPFVATADNIADFFTKPLMGKDFFRMRDKIMNVPHDSSFHPSPP